MLFQDTPYSKKNFKKVNSFIPTFLFYFELKKKNEEATKINLKSYRFHLQRTFPSASSTSPIKKC